jgi:hypothetical protein
MDPLIIPLDDRRVRTAERLDLVGHGAAALGLISAAMDGLPARTGGATALVAVELAAAAALVIAIRRELRTRDEDGAAGISWLNLVAAAVLLVQWYVELRGGGKWFSPELLGGIVAGALALLHPVIQRRRRARRALRIDDAGITLSFGRFRRFSAPWSHLRTANVDADGLHFVTTDGVEQRVSLRMIRNAAEVADAVRAAAERSGVGRISTAAAAVQARG